MEIILKVPLRTKIVRMDHSLFKVFLILYFFLSLLEKESLQFRLDSGTVADEDSTSTKDEYESLNTISDAHKRFSTPQLSAEFSHFSGLSLRLEDKSTSKNDKLA